MKSFVPPFMVLKSLFKTGKVSFPEIRITANAPIPGAVASAQMVSCLFGKCMVQKYDSSGVFGDFLLYPLILLF